MLKNISILALCGGILVACGGGGGAVDDFALLGADFARAFNQDANAEPISLANVALSIDPQRDPFNP